MLSDHHLEHLCCSQIYYASDRDASLAAIYCVIVFHFCFLSVHWGYISAAILILKKNNNKNIERDKEDLRTQTASVNEQSLPLVEPGIFYSKESDLLPTCLLPLCSSAKFQPLLWGGGRHPDASRLLRSLP